MYINSLTYGVQDRVTLQRLRETQRDQRVLSHTIEQHSPHDDVRT